MYEIRKNNHGLIFYALKDNQKGKNPIADTLQAHILSVHQNIFGREWSSEG